MDFHPLQENIKKLLLDTGLDAVKAAYKKSGKFLGDKIADPVTELNNDKIVKQETVEEIIISPKKEMKY